MTDTEENGLYYWGSLVYEKHANTIGLESAAFSGGRIVATSGNDTEVRYSLTDHLGSVRVVATDKDNVLERNDYQRKGGSIVRRPAVLGLRRPNVRPRTRTVALARSLAAIP